MTYEVDYFYADNVWQGNEFQDWYWPLLQPQSGRFWSCTIVPEYSNVAVCEVTRFFWSTENITENLIGNFSVRVDWLTHPGGVNLGFKAIRIPSGR